VIQPSFDAVALVIEMIFYVISPPIQSCLDPVSFFVQMIFNAVAFAVEMVRQLCFPLCSSLVCQRIKVFVDSITSGVKPVINPITSGIEPIIDPIALRIEMAVNSITTPVQPIIDTISEPIIKAFLSQSRYRTPQSQNAKPDHYRPFHWFFPPTWFVI
jgi:phage-related protein